MSSHATDESLDRFLTPGRFVDSAAPAVVSYAEQATRGAADPVERAVLLFSAVRDGIWYDPYSLSTDPAAYRASVIARAPRAYCVPKAVLLTATARALGIPARLGFADVRNHLQSAKLRARMNGSDLFVFHGYSELWLNGRWVKATPAFNAELCARFGVRPIEFDGEHDALLQQFTADGSRYMEYVRDRGWHADLPFDEVIATMRAQYGDTVFGAASSNGSAADELFA